MIRGLYSAATGLEAAQSNHDVIAHNLAHALVPGYRQRGLTFQTFDSALAQAAPGTANQDLGGVIASQVYTNFKAGPVHYTGHELDVALRDESSFFVVQGPSGPLYTRNGSFKLGPAGELLTQDGRAVRGTGGSIVIPPSAANLSIGADGTLSAGGTRIGQLEVVRFANPTELVPVGTTLFAAPASARPQPSLTGVQQGFREESNVQAVNEMVKMIAGMRHAEASQRALRTLAESMQLNTRPTQA